jgi:hypothetical protein
MDWGGEKQDGARLSASQDNTKRKSFKGMDKRKSTKVEQTSVY